MTTSPIAFYYGAGEVERLSRYQRVVLQPGFYSPAELSRLREAAVQPLAYLSLSEDQGPQRLGSAPNATLTGVAPSSTWAIPAGSST
jgi:hypothetical protein